MFSVFTPVLKFSIVFNIILFWTNIENKKKKSTHLLLLTIFLVLTIFCKEKKNEYLLFKRNYFLEVISLIRQIFFSSLSAFENTVLRFKRIGLSNIFGGVFFFASGEIVTFSTELVNTGIFHVLKELEAVHGLYYLGFFRTIW